MLSHTIKVILISTGINKSQAVLSFPEKQLQMIMCITLLLSPSFSTDYTKVPSLKQFWISYLQDLLCSCTKLNGEEFSLDINQNAKVKKRKKESCLCFKKKKRKRKRKKGKKNGLSNTSIHSRLLTCDSLLAMDSARELFSCKRKVIVSTWWLIYKSKL